jgi:hypothetical protein
MFVLYINDIATAIHHSTINMVADDTLLWFYVENSPDCIEKINADLASLPKWLKFNKLKLNVNKTKHMGLSRRRVDVGAHEALSIDNEQLEEVNSIKHLGV